MHEITPIVKDIIGADGKIKLAKFPFYGRQ